MTWPFLMRILFVAIGFEQLSISLLGAILRRAGHTVGLAFSRHLFDDRDMLSNWTLSRCMGEEDILDQVVRFRPDVLCFSALTVNYRWMLDVAQKAKALCGVTTVFGGVHPSAVSDIVLEEPAVDYVCVGEGDVALPVLLRALARGPLDAPLPNIMFRGKNGSVNRGQTLPFLQDLDRLPGFEKDLWVDHVRLDVSYRTMSSRGCPYRCTFCFNNYFATLPGSDKQNNDHYVRRRSVNHFLAELKEAKRRYRFKNVEIFDDIFTLDTGWLKEFSGEYRREIGVPFQCLSHAQFLDEPRARALKEAGCSLVGLGLESADDRYKQTLRRYERNDVVERALTLLERFNIPYTLDHMFGLPGEDVASQDQALALYSRHDPSRIATFWLSYLPGTEMTRNAREQGVISVEEAHAIDRGFGNSVHSIDNVRDPRLRRTYAAYEVLFRLLPLVPRRLRPFLNTRSLRCLPTPALRGLAVVADILTGLVRSNPKLWRYIVETLSGLKYSLRFRFGLTPFRRSEAADTGPLADPAWDVFLSDSVRSFASSADESGQKTISS